MESYKLFQQELKTEQERKDTLVNTIKENEQEIDKLKIKYHDHLLNDDDKKASDTKKKINELSLKKQTNIDKLELLKEGLASDDVYKLADNVVKEADEAVNKLNKDVDVLVKEYNELRENLIAKAKEIRGYKNSHYRYKNMVESVAKKLPEWAKKQSGNIKYYGKISGRDKFSYDKRVEEKVLKGFDPYSRFLS